MVSKRFVPCTVKRKKSSAFILPTCLVLFTLLTQTKSLATYIFFKKYCALFFIALLSATNQQFTIMEPQEVLRISEQDKSDDSEDYSVADQREASTTHTGSEPIPEELQRQHTAHLTPISLGSRLKQTLNDIHESAVSSSSIVEKMAQFTFRPLVACKNTIVDRYHNALTLVEKSENFLESSKNFLESSKNFLLQFFLFMVGVTFLTPLITCIGVSLFPHVPVASIVIVAAYYLCKYYKIAHHFYILVSAFITSTIIALYLQTCGKILYNRFGLPLVNHPAPLILPHAPSNEFILPHNILFMSLIIFAFTILCLLLVSIWHIKVFKNKFHHSPSNHSNDLAYSTCV